MRAFPASTGYSFCLFVRASAAKTNLSLLCPCKFLNFSSQNSSPSSTKCLLSLFRPKPRCASPDPASLDELDVDGDYVDEDDDDYYSFTGDGSDSMVGDGVFIEIKKLENNSRRIRSKIAVDSSLEAIWNVLTDYEKLADFIPGLAVSKLIEKKDKFARLYQVGQQNLPFGLKFNAKAILDCYEKDLEMFASGKKRDIEFKMTEGDFQFFEGKWSIEQLNKPRSEESDSSIGQQLETTLSYFLDVKPKLWLPVHLIEGRLCKEIKSNLSCIREEAKKVILNTLDDQ